ncbi:MAG: alginate lyase family protein, partial [bacterium]
SSHAAVVAQTPRVFLVDAHHLAAQKAAYLAGDPQGKSAVQSLVKRANKDLAIAPVSVTAKAQTPPSGDKHDYMSLSIYAWPNPKTANGLPYVIKDGDKNPSTASIQDKADLTTVMNTAQELGYAYYFTGNQAYAAKASTMLTTWFINPATRMNPNLNDAQAVPGKTDGGSGGIIDNGDLPKVVVAVGLLAGAKSWSTTNTDQMKKWFGAYLTWLRTSAPGKAEGATTNNHLTWYDAQLVSYALFTGQAALASSVAKSAESSIIAKQIRSDGTQPAELARATSWSYSTYNVEALARLAQLASNAHVDLWHYKAPNGASIKAALDYVNGYVTNLGNWPYHQSSKPDLHYLPLALSAAADAYHNAGYQTLANTAIAGSSNLYPAASLVFGTTN